MSSYIPIASQTLSSSASSVTFSSIPTTLGGKTLRDLVVVIDKVRAISSGRTFFMRINGSAVDYFSVYMTSNGPSGQSVAISGDDKLRLYPFAHPAVPGQEPNYMIQLFDYTQTNKHKSGLIHSDNWDAATTRYASRWGSTSAITSLSFAMDSGDMAAGATFNLFGIEG
jgi:hypothetical protein